MSQIPNLNASSPNNQTFGEANTLNNVQIEDFLNIMIAELQNQDPLNPLDNAELIAQIGQIREVGATDKLTETLDSVLLGQNISSATALIGTEIEAISDDNQRVTGEVARVTISNGTPKLHLEVNPGVEISSEPGNLESGTYRYKIVWEDASGNLFGIETSDALQLDEANQSVLINNLPQTDAPKQIYRTKANAGSDAPFYLVTVLPDGNTSSFRDTISDENLSPSILSKTPQYISEPTRSFTVSLNNVGEIRPSSSRPNIQAVPSGTNATNEANDQNGTEAANE
ncbi:MAG: hypothetical protein GXP26_13650 [Planctomycetes bacterium]|nr:hypothetical protein [Planctomycetota bacterium]